MQIADERSLKTGPCYRLVESKFDRDSDLETPVAVFVLEFELYVVTSGLPIVGGIEQPESINNALVDSVFGHLTAAITEIEASLCGRGRPRGECRAFLREDQSGGKRAQYENKDSCFQMTGNTPRSFVWMLPPDAR